MMGIVKGKINAEGRQDADTRYEQAQIRERDIEINHLVRCRVNTRVDRHPHNSGIRLFSENV
jgi:hypothetical protein